MAEFRDLITLQESNMVPANRNVGSALIQKSLERIEIIEGEVLPSLDDNSSKMLNELKKHTKLLEAILNVLKSEDAEYSREDRQEAQAVATKQADVIDKIEENTRPAKVAGKKQDFTLGGVGTAIALALGAIAGAVQGYVKALKLFGSGLAKVINYVVDFFPSIKKAFSAVKDVFVSGVELFKGAFTTFVSKATQGFDNLVGFFRSIFGGEGISKVGAIFSKVKGVITGFFEPIVFAFKEIQAASSTVTRAVGFVGDAISKVKGFFTSIQEFFTLIGGKLSSFGSIFGATAKIVSKLAYPLTVIMTIWDTVKGAIEGFEKEGIVGAISGAIKGFINSLIMGPLDLLKDAVAWIAGAFGFDKAKEALDSFSFADLTTKIIDSVFGVIKNLTDGISDSVDKYIIAPMTDAFASVKDFFIGIKDSVIGMLQGITIPEIAFTIPVIDKKVSIGPFYPFGKAQPKAASTSGATAAAPVKPAPAPVATAEGAKPVAVGSEAVKPGVATAGTVYSQSAQNAQAAQAPSASGSNVVVAPTTNVSNKTTNNVVRIPSRQSDPILNDYFKSRYAF